MYSLAGRPDIWSGYNSATCQILVILSSAFVSTVWAYSKFSFWQYNNTSSVLTSFDANVAQLRPLRTERIVKKQQHEIQLQILGMPTWWEKEEIEIVDSSISHNKATAREICIIQYCLEFWTSSTHLSNAAKCIGQIWLFTCEDLKKEKKKKSNFIRKNKCSKLVSWIVKNRCILKGDLLLYAQFQPFYPTAAYGGRGFGLILLGRHRRRILKLIPQLCLPGGWGVELVVTGIFILGLY